MLQRYNSNRDPNLSLESFISNHFISYGFYFIPKDPSNNIYRHYGMKNLHTSNMLIFFIEDIIHIYLAKMESSNKSEEICDDQSVNLFEDRMNYEEVNENYRKYRNGKKLNSSDNIFFRGKKLECSNKCVNNRVDNPFDIKKVQKRNVGSFGSYKFSTYKHSVFKNNCHFNHESKTEYVKYAFEQESYEINKIDLINSFNALKVESIVLPENNTDIKIEKNTTTYPDIQLSDNFTPISAIYLSVYLHIRNTNYNLLRDYQPINLSSIYFDIYSDSNPYLNLTSTLNVISNLNNDINFKVYKRHKDFNRKVDECIGTLFFRNKNCLVEDDFNYDNKVLIISVLDEDDYSFIQMKQVNKLDKCNDEKDYKRNYSNNDKKYKNNFGIVSRESFKSIKTENKKKYTS